MLVHTEGFSFMKPSVPLEKCSKIKGGGKQKSSYINIGIYSISAIIYS